VDSRLTYRATVLRDWKGSESHDLVQAMLQELYAARLQCLLQETKETFDRHVGYLEGVMAAQRLVDQTILDETRQRGGSHARV